MSAALGGRDGFDNLSEQITTAIEDLTAELFRGKPISLRRRNYLAALRHSPRKFLAYCALVRALKGQYQFFTAASSVLIFEIPTSWDLSDFHDPAMLCFGDNRGKNSEVGFFINLNAKERSRGWSVDTDEHLCRRKLVIFSHEGDQLHPDFVIAADIRLRLEMGLSEDFQALARLMKVGRLASDQIELLTRQESRRMDAVFRYGNPVGPYIERLRSTLIDKNSPKTPLPLTENGGFGEAALWGLQLKKDLSDWNAGRISWGDLETGILISGPPGTGKSQFAISLAHECGIPLLATSLSKWQSEGSLDDLLKAMYSSFSDAKGKAPSLLFIDEIDAIGNRHEFSGKNAQYSNQVVNALLEAVDGNISREGVVVVGATNFPERIDPALLRSGRLGKHFEFDLPTAAERANILEYYLPELKGNLQLRRFAKKLHRYSGADIEAMARGIRLRARADGRDISIDDVQSEMPLSRKIDAQSKFRLAVHEVGHAIVAHAVSPGRVQRIELFDLEDPDTEDFGSYGRVILSHVPSLSTRSSMLDEIATGLGGLSAEEVVFEDRSVSSGGAKGSDLARVSEIAVAMVQQYGFGSSLFCLPGSVEANTLNTWALDPGLRRDADRLLSEQFERCKAILTEHKPVLLAIAMALTQENVLSGPVLDGLLANVSSAFLTS
jgi:hypothetical protein